MLSVKAALSVLMGTFYKNKQKTVASPTHPCLLYLEMHRQRCHLC